MISAKRAQARVPRASQAPTRAAPSGDRRPVRSTARVIALTLRLGLVFTAFAYVLFVRGLRRILASIAGTLGLAEPLVAVALAVLVLGEHLAPPAIVGVLLLLAGVVLASLQPIRQPVATGALVETPR
jgi:DME family drug/metabolite transporter